MYNVCIINLLIKFITAYKVHLMELNALKWLFIKTEIFNVCYPFLKSLKICAFYAVDCDI